VSLLLRETQDYLRPLWAFLLRWLTITRFAFASEKRTFTVLFHTVQGMILIDAVVGGKPASLLLDTEAATPSSARVPPAWMRFSFEPYEPHARVQVPTATTITRKWTSALPSITTPTGAFS
jgi:hypothetical protein